MTTVTTTSDASESTELPLEGQWAVVTGGSMGIGHAISERIVRGGASIVMVARGRPALGEAVAEVQAVARPGQKVIGLTADVSTRGGIDELFRELRERLRRRWRVALELRGALHIPQVLATCDSG